jgi:IclR family transcriptional regulator, acetate operon repressor
MKSDISSSRSALRPFVILEAFRAAGRPLLLSEVARLTGIPISTCHGVLRALAQEGFLYFLSSREVYPTRRLLDMATQIDAQDPIVSRLAGDLERLRNVTHETVVLASLQGDRAVYLLVVESDQQIRYASPPGDSRALHSSALGKAMLAAMPVHERKQRIAALKLTPLTPLTITKRDVFSKEIEATAQRGYSVTRGENSTDVMAIGMPLNVAGNLLAVSVAGPRERVEEREAAIAAHLQRCIKTIQAKFVRA